MKKNLGNAAFATPYFSETETRQIGYTPDKRAVWQNNSGPPFCCVYDAQNTRHLFAIAPGEFEPLPHPHKTWVEIFRNKDNPAPVGTVRGPFTTGDPRKPCVSFMVQGQEGWIPITRPNRSRDEAECQRAAEAYAMKIINARKL